MKDTVTMLQIALVRMEWAQECRTSLHLELALESLRKATEYLQRHNQFIKELNEK